MMRLLAAALTATLLLSGCVTTPTASIRPGLTAAQVANPIPKPGGLTYRWVLTRSDDADFQAVMRLRSTRLSGGRTRYDGAVSIALPPGADLPANANEISRQIADRVFGDPNAWVRFRDDRIEIPASFTMIPQGQMTAVRLLAAATRHQPHDCFAVLGTCSYTNITRLGGRDVRSRVDVTTTETDGIWRANFRSSRGDTSRQVYSIDQNGVLLDALLFDREDGRSVVTKFQRQ